MILLTTVNGVYKQIYNWGTPHGGLSWFIHFCTRATIESIDCLQEHVLLGTGAPPGTHHW